MAAGMITAASIIVLLSPCLASADRLTVVASLFPLYDFAREAAGVDADVSMLLPPGTEPHTWSPRPSDMARISRADLFIYTGPDMEPWVAQVLSSIQGNPRVLEASRGLLSQPASGGKPGDRAAQHDPHAWLDLDLASQMAGRIASALAEVDGAHGSGYTARSEAYRERLKALDARYRDTLSRCRDRKFVFGGHAAFGYLARRYGLEQIPVYGLSPDSEPSPRQVAAIVKTLKEQGLSVVYFEELVNPRLAEVIALEVGARTMVLNPAGNIPARQWREGDTFLAIMEKNLQNLKEGLGCE